MCCVEEKEGTMPLRPGRHFVSGVLLLYHLYEVEWVIRRQRGVFEIGFVPCRHDGRSRRGPGRREVSVLEVVRLRCLESSPKGGTPHGGHSHHVG